MKNIIVVDIDNTVSIVGNRLKYLQQTPKDWDSFYSKCGNDKVNETLQTILFTLELNDDFLFYFITGRPEKVRKITQNWLIRNNIHYDKLFMRKDKDYKPDYILKREIIEPFKDKIFIVFEDRDQVVRMYRDLGITCLQVTDGSY